MQRNPGTPWAPLALIGGGALLLYFWTQPNHGLLGGLFPAPTPEPTPYPMPEPTPYPAPGTVWTLPANMDCKAIQRAWDTAHINTPQDPTLNGSARGGDHPASWWTTLIQNTFPTAPASFVTVMYQQILANYQIAGWNLLVDMPGMPAPCWITKAYDDWRRMVG